MPMTMNTHNSDTIYQKPNLSWNK